MQGCKTVSFSSTRLKCLLRDEPLKGFPFINSFVWIVSVLLMALKAEREKPFHSKVDPEQTQQCPVSQFRSGSTAIHCPWSDRSRNCSAAALSPFWFPPRSQEQVGSDNLAKTLKISQSSTKEWFVKVLGTREDCYSIGEPRMCSEKETCTWSAYSTKTCLWQATFKHSGAQNGNGFSEWPQPPEPWS